MKHSQYPQRDSALKTQSGTLWESYSLERYKIKAQPSAHLLGKNLSCLYWTKLVFPIMSFFSDLKPDMYLRYTHYIHPCMSTYVLLILSPYKKLYIKREMVASSSSIPKKHPAKRQKHDSSPCPDSLCKAQFMTSIK